MNDIFRVLLVGLNSYQQAATDKFISNTNRDELPTIFGIDQTELPAWTNNFQLPKEKESRTELEKLERKIAEYQEAVAKQHESIKATIPQKALFCASGDVFAEAVEHALKSLGFSVFSGPVGRADFLALNGDHLLIIEAKGLEGTAKEANLGQCLRWIADVKAALMHENEEEIVDPDIRSYFATLKQMGVLQSAPKIKGSLIIGTYRKIPLDQRKEPNFPDAMARAITRNEVCALTGVQLLAMQLAVQIDASREKTLTDLIFETNGVITDSPDWRDFIFDSSEVTLGHK